MSSERLESEMPCEISASEKDLSPLRKEFNKETKIIQKAQSLLEAQYVWRSVQRSSLFRAEAEVASLKKSTGVLT